MKTLLSVVILLALLGIFLPNSYKVSRELVMRAPASGIHSHIANMEAWPEWTVWDESAPPVGSLPAAMESGIGSGLYFSGTEGSGWYIITNDSGIDGFEYVVYSNSGDEAKAMVTFTDLGDSTKVTWVVNGSVTSPPGLAPYIALSKEFILGSSLNQNLKNLKYKVEQNDRK